MSSGSSLCERARRSRPAGGHIHLRAQMKVTKAKDLNAIWLADVAANHEQDLIGASHRRPRMHRAQRQAMDPWPKTSRIEWTLFGGSSQVARSNRVEPLCFGYFHLGPQMKVARPPAETGALSRSEQTP